MVYAKEMLFLLGYTTALLDFPKMYKQQFRAALCMRLQVSF